MPSRFPELSTGPVDLSKPCDPSWIKGKTTIITGGAHGIGAEVAKHWASLGANIIIADCNVEGGQAVVASLRAAHPDGLFLFQECDVASWESQVDLFETADAASNDRGIDVVFANAGVCPPQHLSAFEFPDFPEGTRPAKPASLVIDVNVTGAAYSAHLGLIYMGNDRNARRISAGLRTPGEGSLLLMASIAGVIPAPGLSFYSMSKHAVVGLFRSLRQPSAKVHGVRTNVLCPYFVANSGMAPPIVEKMVNTGSPGICSMEDVVDAATRLAADPANVGRGLVVAPRMKSRVNQNGDLVSVGSASDGADAQFEAIYDCYLEDDKRHNSFTLSLVSLMNHYVVTRSWWRYFKQVLVGGGN